MKKWLLLIAAVFFIAILSIYVFIPSSLNISAIVSARATRDGTFRTIASKNKWQKWWNYGSADAASPINDSIFSNNNYQYKLVEAGFNNALVTIQHNNNSIKSNVSLFQFKIDSIGIVWQCSLQTTANPINRIKQYLEAVNLKKNITGVLNNLKAFVEKDENIYGIKISKGQVRDTLLLTTKQMFTKQPGMNDVYSMINGLKEYATSKNCRQTDVPMLNILQDINKYRVMVALPIDKEIETSPPISFVKMTNGNFMVTKVQGGLLTVQNALDQMQLYFQDYDKTAMAITFQYLLTDRIKETDTTKWITEIYAPVL